MAKRYLHNEGTGVMFAGGVMIPPGEGREVDTAFLPPEHQEPPPPPEDQEPPAPEGDQALIEAMTAELDKPLSQILPALKTRSAQELTILRTLEDASPTPRKTLQAKISEALLDLAQQSTGGAPE